MFSQSFMWMSFHPLLYVVASHFYFNCFWRFAILWLLWLRPFPVDESAESLHTCKWRQMLCCVYSYPHFLQYFSEIQGQYFFCVVDWKELPNSTRVPAGEVAKWVWFDLRLCRDPLFQLYGQLLSAPSGGRRAAVQHIFQLQGEPRSRGLTDNHQQTSKCRDMARKRAY